MGKEEEGGRETEVYPLVPSGFLLLADFVSQANFFSNFTVITPTPLGFFPAALLGKTDQRL